MCIRRSRNVAVLKTTQLAEEKFGKGNLETSLFSSAGRKHLWHLETRPQLEWKTKSEKSQKVDQRVKKVF